MRRRSMLLGLAALTAFGGVAQAQAQPQDFPNRPIKWVVPYLPGTSPDTTVRIVADAMAAVLKQTIVVENKAGAAGNLGAQQAARSAPDGYTWVYSASPMSASMVLYQKPGFDVLKDFTHVGRMTSSDVLLVVNANSAVAGVKDLIELGRKNPGKLAYASGGVGTPAHMGAELMLNATGVRALHVPYKGASESANAVLGNQVDFALTTFAVSLPQVEAGKLRALAVGGSQRNPRLPGVPTLTEAGVAVQLTSFGGLSVPAGTPAPIVKRIAQALNAALAMPEVRAKLEAIGSTVAPSSPDEYADMLKAEIALTEKMMKVANIQPQ